MRAVKFVCPPGLSPISILPYLTAKADSPQAEPYKNLREAIHQRHWLIIDGRSAWWFATRAQAREFKKTLRRCTTVVGPFRWI